MKNLYTGMLLLLIAALLLLGASSCATVSYRDDVAVGEILDAAKSALGESDYMDADGDTYTVYFGGEDAFAAVEDCGIVYHKTTTNVDQFGVFRVKAGEGTADVREMVEEYLAGQQSYLNSFATAYNQAELSKIENAEVGVVGCYVWFAILDGADADAFADALAACISK